MIDQETLNRLAKASKLKFDANEEVIFLKDLNRIISFIDKLNEIDVSNVSDFNFVNHFKIQLRSDKTEKFQNTELIKKNATKFRNNYFVIADELKKERK